MLVPSTRGIDDMEVALYPNIGRRIFTLLAPAKPGLDGAAKRADEAVFTRL
jgi:hypothetical protein